MYEEWINWAHFLGNKIVSKFDSTRIFLPFAVARKFTKSLGLRCQKDWQVYCISKLTHLPKKPLEIPSNPGKKYKGQGWSGFADWLGY